MINFILKKVSDNSSHYNLTFTKLVHKRTGEIAEEPGDTIYTLPLDLVKSRIAHVETSNRFGDRDITLKEYIPEFYKSYNDVCELLKRTL